MLKKIISLVKNHKITSAIVLCAVIFLGYLGINQLLAKPATTTYDIEAVKKGDIKTTVSTTGQVANENEQDITAEVSGEVTEVAVSTGQEVKQGDLVAVIDSSDLEDQITDAALALESAQVNLQKMQETDDAAILKAANDLQAAKNSLTELKITQANQLSAVKEEKANAEYSLAQLNKNDPDYKTKYENYKSQLNEANRKIGEYNTTHPLQIQEAEANISQKELSLNEAREGADQLDLRLQENTVAQKQTALNELETKRAKYRITAPADGIISAVNVSVGNTAGSGQSSASSGNNSSATSSTTSSSSSSSAIATLISHNKVAEITINEVDVINVAVGQPAILTFDAIDGLEITGKVKEIDLQGTVDQGVVYNNAIISFDNQDGRIRSGMSANVEIITEEKNDIVVVSSSAIKSSGVGEYVDLVTETDSQINSAGTVEKAITTPKQIETGITDGLYTEIVSGLEVGDFIVVKTTTTENEDEEDNNSSDQESNSLLPFGNNGGTPQGGDFGGGPMGR